MSSTPQPQVSIQQTFNEKNLQNTYGTLPRPSLSSKLFNWFALFRNVPFKQIPSNPTGASVMRNTKSQQIFLSIPL